ncbi:MAG: hypothetical protein CMF51_02460 [Legionellales bacterium]|nr:hypothetical protein [Legionellales bacterium]
MIELSESSGYSALIESIIAQIQPQVDQAEVSIESHWTGALAYRHSAIERLGQYASKILVVKVYQYGSIGVASTTDFSKTALDLTCKKAIEIAHITAQDPNARLVDADELVKIPINCDVDHPWDLTHEEALSHAQYIEDTVMSVKGVQACDGVDINRYRQMIWLANTNGLLSNFSKTLHSMSVSCLAKAHDALVSGYTYTRSVKPNGLMPLKVLAESAAHQTLKKRYARSLSEQTVPVLFSPEMSRQVMAQLASAIDGHAIYRGASFLCDGMGRKIFPEYIDVIQQPHLLGQIGARPFDDEGVQTRSHSIIDQGVLACYSLDGYTARRLNQSTNANAGGIQTWTVIDRRHPTFKELLLQMGRGLYVTEMMGSGDHLVTGDFSRGVFGFWVEAGEIQYPIHEITIAGNLAAMFQGCLGIAQDTVDHRGVIQTGAMLIDSMTIAGMPTE